MSMIALRPLLKLQVLISLVLSLGLILNSLLISSNLLLHILICLKENWIKHHEPFKEICKEDAIVNDDCNMHDAIPENEVLYKHVNYLWSG